MIIWVYITVSFLIGLLVGLLLMRYGNRQLRETQTLHTELSQKQQDLEQYRQALSHHFAHSADLLNTLAKDYQTLYQHMAKSSNELLPELPTYSNPFAPQEENNNTKDNTPPHHPRDYAAQASGLLRNHTPH